MHKRRSFLSLAAAGVCAWLVLAACSGGKIGYGVVLWAANNSPIKTGQIVTVKSESQITNTYSVALSGSNAPLDVPNWRIKLFHNEKSAINFSLTYSSMVPMFAKATTNGASIRQKADSAAPRVYRMREGQMVKVISEEPNKVTVEGVDGHWYEVLTSDGVLGYTFGANLEVYNPAVQTQTQVSAGQQLLNKVLATTYRPQYFQQMIDNKQIDLKKFSSKFGFFADAAAKKIRVVTPDYALNFDYTGTTERAPGDYTFNGTSLEMIIQSADKIQLLYTGPKGNQYDQLFVDIKQDIGYLVEKEKNRRLQIYNGFLDKAPYSSDYYGKIGLGADMGFTWTGYSRLVPDIVPSGAGSTGVVGFPLFLDPSLQGSYDGVITFTFGAQPTPGAGTASAPGGAQSGSGVNLAQMPAVSPGGGQPTDGTAAQSGQTGSVAASAGQDASANQTVVSFLYSFTSAGVKLTYVPPSTVNGDLVTNVSSTPIIIVFTSKASGG